MYIIKKFIYNVNIIVYNIIDSEGIIYHYFWCDQMDNIVIYFITLNIHVIKSI